MSTNCEEISDEMVEKYAKDRIPARPVGALIVMLACFSVLGLLGNSLVLYVYVRKRNKLSSTVFIIALAATDLVTSAVSMPYTMVVEGLNYQIPWDISCKLYYFVITCTVPFSVFIMVAIAIDRYICICRPHSHVLDSRRARNSVLALLVLAILIGLVPAMFHGVYIDLDTLAISQTSQTGQINNITHIIDVLETEPCTNGCAHESEIDEKFQMKIMAVVFELVKRVCTQETQLNTSYIYTGRCWPNQILFSNEFRKTYQTLYSSTFLFCFAVVFVLYILIYKSVLVRRARRLAARTKAKLNLTQEVSLTENQSMLHDSPDKSIALNEIQNGSKAQKNRAPTQQQYDSEIKSENNEGKLLQPGNTFHKGLSQRGEKRASSGCLKDKYFLANFRTAIMLFVVTVAFVIAYLPSWLIAYKVLKFNVVIFYVYFSNHIVNPIIYAFMNPAFRRSLKALVCRKKSRAV